MVSFEVESLFTNISLQETIDLCVENLSEDTLNESFILFDNEHYRQYDGVAIGSPLEPTFANIFLLVHEIF